MDYPSVEVVDLTNQDRLVTKGPNVNLGGKHSEQARTAEAQINALLSAHRQTANRVFLLMWKGDKIPRGAQILDKTIAWTQNGIVASQDGKMIGTYDRIVEYGGESGNEHQMMVFAQ